MERLEDYVEAVTRRLRPDAELHMDVAHEVRAHLEEAAEEARAQGMGDEQATEAALKAFGDRERVAEDLWQANRGRMRLRAVAKWAARVTLLPAALALTAYLCATYFVQTCQAGTVMGSLLDAGWVRRILPRRDIPPLEPREDLTEDERFVFDHISNDVADARALVDRHPDDPAVFAQYVVLLGARGELTKAARPSDAESQNVLAVLEKGERIEPQNAFYNYLKASLLMGRSSQLVEEKEGIHFSYVDRQGERKEAWGGRLVIDDPATFERGLAEVYKGTRKPYWDAHTGEMERRKLSLAKAPRTLPDHVRVVALVAATRFPPLDEYRRMLRRLPAYAHVMASAGKEEEATRLLQVMDRPAGQMGAGAQTYIGMLVARGYQRTALGHAPAIYETMDMPEAAANARERFETENTFWNSLWTEYGPVGFAPEEAKRYGAIYTALAPGIPGLDHAAQGRPYRVLEHVLLEQAALGSLAALMLVVLLLCSAGTCWRLWKHRGRADGPKLFFVGWRRLGAIVLCALVAPIGLYAAYGRLAPFSGAQYGIHYAWGRTAVELGVVAALVLIGVLAASYRAIRARCRDAGMSVPAEGLLNPFRGRVAPAALALLVLGIGAAFLFTEAGSAARMRAGTAGSVMVLLCTLVYVRGQFWLLTHRPSGPSRFVVALAGNAAMIAFIVYVAAVMVFVVSYWVSAFFAIAAIIVAACAVAVMGKFWLRWRRLHEQGLARAEPHFRTTFVRSLVPILTVCLLVLGAAGHTSLRFTEARCVGELNPPGGLLMQAEIERSSLKHYRDHLREQNREWLEQQGLPPGSPPRACHGWLAQPCLSAWGHLPAQAGAQPGKMAALPPRGTKANPHDFCGQEGTERTAPGAETGRMDGEGSGGTARSWLPRAPRPFRMHSRWRPELRVFSAIPAAGGAQNIVSILARGPYAKSTAPRIGNMLGAHCEVIVCGLGAYCVRIGC